MKVEIPDLTGAECGEIAITAAEGGIGYWSIIDAYRPTRDDGLGEGWVDPKTNECLDVADDFVFYTLHEISDEKASEYEGMEEDITPRLIRLGLETAITEGFLSAVSLLASAREDWTSIIDSELADTIIQIGMFGEVRYG